VIETIIVPTELIFIGTLHGGHNTAKFYTYDALCKILTDLHPIRICLEGDEEGFGDDGYLHYDMSEEELKAARHRMPEGAAVDDVSRQLQIKLLPFDWKGFHTKRFKETRHWERTNGAVQAFSQFLEKMAATDPTCLAYRIAEMLERAITAQMWLDQNAPPEVINSDAYDNLARIKQSMPMTFLPLLRGQQEHEEMLADFDFIWSEWQIRNDHMAENLIRICSEFPGQHVVVVTGADHRSALRDRLAGRPGIVLKEYWEVLPA
jgi:hypothetical protein